MNNAVSVEMTRKWALACCYFLAILVVVLDQLSKNWAQANLLFGVPSHVLPFFDLTLLYNKGAAFSFLSDASGWQRYFFITLASLVSIFLLFWIPQQKRWSEKLALSLILGGAVGNLYDRLVLGHVVDFISLHYRDHYWPAFNLADSAITLGAIVLFVEWIVLNRNEEK